MRAEDFANEPLLGLVATGLICSSWYCSLDVGLRLLMRHNYVPLNLHAAEFAP